MQVQRNGTYKPITIRLFSKKCAAFAFIIMVVFSIIAPFVGVKRIGIKVIAVNDMAQYWLYNIIPDGYQLHNNQTRERPPTPEQKNPVPGDYFRPVDRGTNLQAGDRQVHITTAVHYHDYPQPGSFNLMLNGWAKFNASMHFKCCLIPSLKADKPSIVEVPAVMHHIYLQWIVHMQSAEFRCSLPNTTKNFNTFPYVTFVEKTCSNPPKSVLKIEYPRRFRNSVGICLKISYGDLDLEKMLEWFEYAKLLKVTRVFTFLSSDLNPESRRIFDFYNATGFLEANPINPAIAKNGKGRGFRRPRYERQAWVDEVMACNDCKHRMSGFDYVIVQDIDEYVVPKVPHGSYLAILRETSRKNPRAGSFIFDSSVVASEWNETRASPLHLMSKIHRTSFVNYNDPGTDTRWAFMPHRTFFVKNNQVYVRKPFRTVHIPKHLYILQHRRRCKEEWKNCQHLDRKYKVMDASILRFETRLVSALNRLPLSELLPGPKHSSYIEGLRSWSEQNDNNINSKA